MSETSDTSTSARGGLFGTATSNPLDIPPTSTTTLGRRGTTSRRGRYPQPFYPSPARDLRSETPPSLRWTHNVQRSRTSCVNCAANTLMSFSQGGTSSVPTLSRSNADVGFTSPVTPTSTFPGRYKIGSMSNLRKR